MLVQGSGVGAQRHHEVAVSRRDPDIQRPAVGEGARRYLDQANAQAPHDVDGSVGRSRVDDDGLEIGHVDLARDTFENLANGERFVLRPDDDGDGQVVVPAGP